MQMMLYQLSRLLYDLNPNLYYLLKDNEVTPFYYAAPWFLTLFASQFPIAFCARVLGTIHTGVGKGGYHPSPHTAT